MPTSSPLPSFGRPPVGEVLLALQFQHLEHLTLRHVGPLVERFGSMYLHFEAQAPLPPAIERFDGLRPMRGITVDMMEVPLFPRLWLVDAKGEELVQIQRDRLMHNWRHTPIGSEYPRYPRLRDQFASDWGVVDAFVRENNLGTLLPTQCEVAYINQIEADGGDVHDDPSKYFSFFAPSICAHGQSQFEAVSHSSSGIAQEHTDMGLLMGRLFVEVTSGINMTTKKRTYQFGLTLRGAPLAQDLASVLQFFDFARARIVRAFSELTTPEMHSNWERLQ